MNVLFICKYNRFRSKAAEGLLKKLRPQESVRSAGIIPGLPPDEDIVQALDAGGVGSSGIDCETRGVDFNALMWADEIIIVANDVPAGLFNYFIGLGKRVLTWDIQDSIDGEPPREKVLDIIKRKVEQYHAELGS